MVVQADSTMPSKRASSVNSSMSNSLSSEASKTETECRPKLFVDVLIGNFFNIVEFSSEGFTFFILTTNVAEPTLNQTFQTIQFCFESILPSAGK